MKETFYSHGKLLLTGEYAVLDGATALALPTIFGQALTIESTSEPHITWKSFDHDGKIWFEDAFSMKEIIELANADVSSVRHTLLEILHEAAKLNPKTLEISGYSIETHLTFPRNWGLGTSSTLINNIAQWFNVNAFELLKNSFGGSGFDIAAAQNDTPIFYTLIDERPVVKLIAFNPEFKDNLYFIYLNRKQSSKIAIESYRQNRKDDFQQTIDRISEITLAMSNNTYSEFRHAIAEHESIIGELININPIQQTTFSDFNGQIKSLGGWGGDFILAVSDEDPSDYFLKKGFPITISYNDMIL